MSSGVLFVINLDDLLFPENQKPKQNKQIIILKKERRKRNNKQFDLEFMLMIKLPWKINYEFIIFVFTVSEENETLCSHVMSIIMSISKKSDNSEHHIQNTVWFNL